MANSVDVDEVALFELPHQDLHCLQMQLFSSLVLLKRVNIFFSPLLMSSFSSFPFTVPCRIVFAKPEDHGVSEPPQFPFLGQGQEFVIFSKSCLDFLRTSSL